MSGWGINLNGVFLAGGDASYWESVGCEGLGDPEIKGCLTYPPDGLGLPSLRTEDITYAQRDGVKHFADWYDPRIITLSEVYVCPDGCPECPSARAKVRDILQAWKRTCDDTELVIYTDCHGTDETTPPGSGSPLVGPFGAVGRPRVAEVEWVKGVSKCAVLLLRFDAVDHRLYVLDECGTPGSGASCTSLTPDTVANVMCVGEDGTFCMPLCFNSQEGEPGAGPQEVENIGTECACGTITLNGQLSNPFVENLTTGQRLDYAGVIGAGDAPVIIDTCTGTATQDGASRTHLLTGDVTMAVEPGMNTLRLGSTSPVDDGTADYCFRPTVVFA